MRTNLHQAIRSTDQAPRVIIYALWHMKAALFGDYNLGTLNRDNNNHEDSYSLRYLSPSRVRVYLPRSFVSLKLATTALAVCVKYIRSNCKIFLACLIFFPRKNKNRRNLEMGRLGSEKGVKSSPSPLLDPPLKDYSQPFKFVKACYAIALQSIAKNVLQGSTTTTIIFWYVVSVMHDIRLRLGATNAT